MPLEQYSEGFFKGQAYALVIGISNYLYGKKPGELTGGNQFLHLKCAANDAEDFANFLKTNGMIPYNVRTLINEQATLSGIRTELDKLAQNCQQLESKDEGPLVVIFFSGHGMVDSQNRHYLLPWEAMGNSLFGTALLHKDFLSCIDAIKTNRLVVFTDACHSGVTGDEGAKGTVAPPELGEGMGRYSIASCLPGQFSYEVEGARNSIFTEKLLQLLRCEEPDAIPEDTIDIFPLYTELRKRVKAAAKEHGWEQEPTVPKLDGGTGIILAINQRRREAAIKTKQQIDDARKEFLNKVCRELAKREIDKKAIIQARLESYVLDRLTNENLTEFFSLFDEYCESYRTSKKLEPDYIDLIVAKYNRVSNRALASTETPSQSPSKGVDAFISAPQAATAATKTPDPQRSAPAADLSQLPAAPLISTQEDKEERRQLLPEDVDAILAKSETELDFYSEARQLRNYLRLPISQPEFAKQISAISRKRTDDLAGNLLQEIIRLFKEKWPKAPIVQTQTVSSLISARIQ